MKKQRVTLYIDMDMWREFRATCVRRGVSASHIVDILISDQMSAWMLAGELKDTDQGTNDGQRETKGRLRKP